MIHLPNILRLQRSLLSASTFALTLVSMAAEPGQPELRLWYEQPAQVWTEALPVGNGSLGAMIYGGVEEEQIQFNEDTLWGGVPHEYQHEGAVKSLDALRQMLWEGEQDAAEELAMEAFMSQPLRQMMYKPFGDLRLEFPAGAGISDYARDLDLRRAVAAVHYQRGDVRYRRETFSSHPDQVIVTRIEADRPGSVDVVVRLSSPHEGSRVEVSEKNELLLSGRVAPEPSLVELVGEHEGMRFAARIQVRHEGGHLSSSADGAIELKGADTATILLTAGTAYKSFQDISGDPEAETAKVLAALEERDYGELVERHREDHEALFGRVEIDLGSSPFADWATDRRLERAEKSDDPQLAALFYQYGRYLLIASSRPGAQPANLQGIWNDRMQPPWGSKYTLNINAEMNYWPAEVANLSELHEPFFAMIEELAVSGEKTARAHYGAGGWVVHHNTDLWRGTAPINHSDHGIWPTGSAWLVQHLWEHYRYTLDEEFLADRAYPVMKRAALFYLDYLVEHPVTGELVSGPSNSPEHGGLVMGPTMDHQLIRSLFGWVIEAAGILGVDEAFAKQLEATQRRIPGNRIGRLGQLQEWLEDLDDPDNRHRHVSHLWGVFPGQDITWKEPRLMEAARRSLELRGDGGTGWALGWKVALWARFLDGDRAHRVLMNQFNLVRDDPAGVQHSGEGGVYPNLFDAHPPFQIDGNFAATGAISEMIMQSHLGEIVLLPALPTAFRNGSIKGLRARGGFELDLAWEEGRLRSFTIRADRDGEARLRYGNRVADVRLKAGESKSLGPGLREMAAYTGGRSPLELSQWLVESQVSRFREWLPEGRDVPARWDYSLAIFALGCVDLAERTGDDRWLAYAEGIIGDCVDEEGTIRGYRTEDYNLDMVKPGSPALALLERTGDPRYQQIAATLRAQLEAQPRTESGGFWHKQRYPWQMWLDGLYMGAPFLAQYGAIFDEPAAFDEVVQQITLIDQYTWDAAAGLHHHAWDEKRQQVWADPQTGLSSNFWSRSIGWYGMALVDVLDFLPADHEGRGQILEILERWAPGVQRHQDPETGLWWQVTDQGGRVGNYLEGTASAIFVYTLAKAINEGYLERERFGPVLEKAWEGIGSELLDVDAEGRLSLAQCCRVAGLSDDRDGSYAYYLSERIVHNDIKGVGPFIRAGLELERYFNRN